MNLTHPRHCTIKGVLGPLRGAVCLGRLGTGKDPCPPKLRPCFLEMGGGDNIRIDQDVDGVSFSDL